MAREQELSPQRHHRLSIIRSTHSFDAPRSLPDSVQHQISLIILNLWQKVHVKTLSIILCLVGSVLFYSLYEGWPVLDSFFFVLFSITTIGYGTPAPSNDPSRVFTIVLMIFGVYLIFSTLNHFVDSSIHTLNRIVKRRLVRTMLRANELFKRRLVVSVSGMILVLILAALVLQANEGWSFISALYFAVQTVTTVGYGEFSIGKESSKAFLCVYMVIATGLSAFFLNNLRLLIQHRRLLHQRKELLKLQQRLDFLADLNGGQGIGKHEFVMTILEHLGTIDRERDIDPWLEKFTILDTDHSGILTKEQLMAFSKREQQKSEVLVDHINASSKILLPHVGSFKSTSFHATDVDAKDLDVEDAANHSFSELPFIANGPSTVSSRVGDTSAASAATQQSLLETAVTMLDRSVAGIRHMFSIEELLQKEADELGEIMNHPPPARRRRFTLQNIFAPHSEDVTDTILHQEEHKQQTLRRQRRSSTSALDGNWRASMSTASTASSPNAALEVGAGDKVATSISASREGQNVGQVSQIRRPSVASLLFPHVSEESVHGDSGPSGQKADFNDQHQRHYAHALDNAAPVRDDARAASPTLPEPNQAYQQLDMKPSEADGAT